MKNKEMDKYEFVGLMCLMSNARDALNEFIEYLATAGRRVDLPLTEEAFDKTDLAVRMYFNKAQKILNMFMEGEQRVEEE
jgi:hypothetical protein